MEVDPSREPPQVVVFSRRVILQAATTHIECAAATSIKMGAGITKMTFIAEAVQGFRARTDSAAPSETMHPALFALIKSSKGSK